MTIKIEVTKRDITSFLPEHQRTATCPVAKALKRVGFRNPLVAYRGFHCSESNDSRQFILLPSAAADFIVAFDKNSPAAKASPFVFSLTLKKSLAEKIMFPKKFALLTEKKAA